MMMLLPCRKGPNAPIRGDRTQTMRQWFCLAIALATVACASKGPQQPPTKLRWPDEPDPARIEFDSIISSAADLKGPPGFRENFANFIGLSLGADVKGIVQPADVEVTPDGKTVYVSDFAQGIVHVYDLENREARYLGESEPFQRPFGLALDSSGNLYLAEQDLQQIRVLDPSGNTLGFYRSDKLVRPVDIAIDEPRGRLYVADGSHQDSKEHYVRIFDLEGNYLGEVGEGRGTGEGRLLFPTYLAVSDDGSLYVSDTMNSRVSVFDSEGRFLRTVGARGDGFGLFDKPKGIALDAFGNLYVVDSSWSNVQIFGPEGHVLLYFGGRGGYPGLLRNPTGIAIARGTNRIFVGDYLNRRVTIYQLVNTDADDGLPADTGASAAAPGQ